MFGAAPGSAGGRGQAQGGMPARFGGFNSEQDQLLRRIEILQARDHHKVANSITDRCFRDCAVQFRTRKLDNREELCTVRCIEKYIATQARVVSIYHQNQDRAEKEQQQRAAAAALGDDDDDDDDDGEEF
jgi:hypothetical protein